MRIVESSHSFFPFSVVFPLSEKEKSEASAPDRRRARNAQAYTQTGVGLVESDTHITYPATRPPPQHQTEDSIIIE